VFRVKAYSGGVLARALPEGLRYLSTWAWLSSDRNTLKSNWTFIQSETPYETDLLFIYLSHAYRDPTIPTTQDSVTSQR